VVAPLLPLAIPAAVVIFPPPPPAAARLVLHVQILFEFLLDNLALHDALRVPFRILYHRVQERVLDGRDEPLGWVLEVLGVPSHLLDGIGLRPDHRRCTLLLLLRSPSTTILDPVRYRISLLLLPVVIAAGGTIAQTASAASAAAAAAAAAAAVVRPAGAVDAPSAAAVVDTGVSPAIVAVLRLVHPRALHGAACGEQ